MDFNLDAFYRERDCIMTQPDEDLNEYRKRITTENKSHFIQADFNFASLTEEESPKLSALDITKNSDAPITTLGKSNTQAVDSSNCLGSSTGTPPISSGMNRAMSPSAPQLMPLIMATTSRVQRPAYHNQNEASQIRGQIVGGPLHAQSSTGRSDQVSGLVFVEGGNVEESHDRIRGIGIKRELSSIQSTSPAKRSRKDQDRQIWRDFPIRQASSVSVSHTDNPPPLLESRESGQITGDTERPSEILSFPPSPRRSPQGLPSPARSSPISSFSGFMARSPSSGLRQNLEKAPKPASTLKLPFGPLFSEPTLKQKRVNAAVSRDQEDPLTSPIEDLSMQELIQPAASEKTREYAVTSASGKLCLEVKERAAKHAAMKQQDKVISLGSKATVSHIPSRPVMREDPVQEETPAVSRIPARLVSHTSTPSHDSEAERPAKPRTTQHNRVQPKAQKSKTTKKEKQAPVSPIEYAQQLLQRTSLPNKPRNSNALFLEGKSIFYIGGDMQYAGERTRGRMDLIVKHGGNLIPSYDPTVVTHIVTDANKQPTLRALGYKRLSDIPDHIPTVKWSWIKSGITRLNRFDKEDIKIKLEDVWMHAAFSERMDIMGRGKSAVPPIRTLMSTRISSTPQEPNVYTESTSTQNKATPLPSPVLVSAYDAQNDQMSRPGTPSFVISVDKEKGPEQAGIGAKSAKQNVVDPLEEFYAEAREAHENSWHQVGECDESESEINFSVNETAYEPLAQQRKQRWTCDSKEPQGTACANQGIIDKLQELQELHKAKLGEEDHWRAYSYNKSIRAIRGYPKRIQSYSEARSIRGVGDKTALKVMEILQTGDLRRINYERTDDVEVTRLFQGIYGVGQSTAFKWYCAGCRTLEDLRNQKGDVRLNSVQLIGLQYYDDINNRMPRSEAKAVFDLIKPLALSIDSKLFVEIMGSYRRGKHDCGDIDILITRPIDDDKTHSGILARLLPILHKEGIITEDLAIPEDFRDLECVYRGLCRLPQEGSRRRRIDFLTVPWESRGAALLYYTGDDIFNRAMRFKANKMGYSLNQRGLFSGVVRDPQDFRIKSNEGTLVASETEEEIFRILGVPWQEPHERVRA